jgi:hypothetical protein
MVDKLVISNRAALAGKYGPAGLATVQAALNALVAADAARGLTTQVLEIDDAGQMAAVGGSPVAGPADERGAKAAVDAAFSKFSPDYALLLDGPDVVPHIGLAPIAGLNDGDLSIPSDLPYASAAGWSRQASAYLSVTRVVGRLPAPPGVTQAGPLADLIRGASAHAPRPASDFTPPFSISADVWRQSTQLSVATTFGPGMTVHLSPPDGHPGIDPDLPRLAHFINCHGAASDDKFYGQQGANYPVALESAPAQPHLAADTVAAAECCFGAELYDYRLAGTAQPICMAYLSRGAAAFVGSTNIAYGPSAGNGQADLLTQYFLQHVLTGATTGRAFLQARQDFIRTQAMANSANLKTLAQFILLGDPSRQPCVSTPPHGIDMEAMSIGAKSMAVAVDPASLRKIRRVALHSEGLAVAATATHPGRVVEAKEDLRAQLLMLARDRGVGDGALTVMETEGGSLYKLAAHDLEGERKVAVMVDVRQAEGARPGPFVRLMVAHIVDDRVVRVEASESR